MTDTTPLSPDWCEICERDPVESGPVKAYEAVARTNNKVTARYNVRLCEVCTECPPEDITLSPVPLAS